VNIKGLHLALKAAHEANINQAVYASTMSIYGGDLMQRHFSDEGITPDAIELYGFTKGMGEQVCQNAVRLWGMNINALRLCHPTAEEKWRNQTVLGTPTIHTTAADVARAMSAALDYQGGFKAKRLLNWQPLARPNGYTSQEHEEE
jgi:nucleoside-diphosphate-sugar epimerase